jgi:hypothetical protein
VRSDAPPALIRRCRKLSHRALASRAIIAGRASRAVKLLPTLSIRSVRSGIVCFGSRPTGWSFLAGRLDDSSLLVATIPLPFLGIPIALSDEKTRSLVPRHHLAVATFPPMTSSGPGDGLLVIRQP